MSFECPSAVRTAAVKPHPRQLLETALSFCHGFSIADVKFMARIASQIHHDLHGHWCPQSCAHDDGKFQS
jgi:hypothetical protein